MPDCNPFRSAQMFGLPGYDAFLGFLLIAGAVPVLALVTNKLVSPRSQVGERELTYESGMEPIGGAWIQFNIRYYMFALVFVIFDVETVYLYPWAVAFHRLGILAFIEALVTCPLDRLKVHLMTQSRHNGTSAYSVFWSELKSTKLSYVHEIFRGFGPLFARQCMSWSVFL